MKLDGVTIEDLGKAVASLLLKMQQQLLMAQAIRLPLLPVFLNFARRSKTATLHGIRKNCRSVWQSLLVESA
jgi:hypothetical protein